MKEEKVTLAIIEFLKAADWEILSFDYPQSGTGVTIHPANRQMGAKRENTITPDIIALKIDNLIVMENKVYFSAEDVKKLRKVKKGVFTRSLRYNFPDINWQKIWVGLGISDKDKELRKALANQPVFDFLLSVTSEGVVSAEYLRKEIENLF